MIRGVTGEGGNKGAELAGGGPARARAPVHRLEPKGAGRPDSGAVRVRAAPAHNGAVRPLDDERGVVVAVVVAGRHLQPRQELREELAAAGAGGPEDGRQGALPARRRSPSDAAPAASRSLSQPCPALWASLTRHTQNG